MLPLKIEVNEGSQVSEARRRASKLATAYGWPESELGKVGLAVTELAKNLVKHSSGDGEIIIWADAEARSLVILALDRGPGIRNVSQALTDGYSTAGSPGTGLGAVKRLASEFDIYSGRDRGTAVMARIDRTRRQDPGGTSIAVDGLRLPKEDEDACGDALAWGNSHGRFLAFLVDGLGHGVMAAEAADTAVRAFRKNLHLPPDRLLEAVHLALKATRGGVAAVAEISEDRKQVNYVGIGNINALLHSTQGSKSLVSYNGTLGQEVRKFHTFSYPWTADSILVMHSDGLRNRWDLSSYPGIERRPTALMAGVLYRDLHRERDDLSVLVARQGRQ